jgi:ankyrin repeat protein
MWAAAQGHAAMVEALLEGGADVDARSAVIAWERQRTQEPREKWLPPGGLNPLLLASRQGCSDCAKVLIAHGADRNTVDPQGNSALLLAAINGHFDTAALLVKSGTDPNIAEETGQAPLYAVVDMSSMPQSNRPSPKVERNETTAYQVMTMLLDAGANPNARLREMRPYRTKLDRGGDSVLGEGTTPLLRAAKGGDLEALKLLLARGADPRLATAAGVNAIMMVAGVGTKEEDTTGRGRTEPGIVECIKLLADAGVDVNGADAQGRTAAHGAAMWGYTEVVTYLHQRGAKLDAKDKRGLTPLDAAMGLAGGLGFDGKTGAVHEKTAEAIREILRQVGSTMGSASGAANR